MTISITTLRKMTLSIRIKNAALYLSNNQHNDTQHNDTQHNDAQHNDIQHKNKNGTLNKNDT
jgi:hypothetical protein